MFIDSAVRIGNATMCLCYSVLVYMLVMLSYLLGLCNWYVLQPRSPVCGSSRRAETRERAAPCPRHVREARRRRRRRRHVREARGPLEAAAGAQRLRVHRPEVPSPCGSLGAGDPVPEVPHAAPLGAAEGRLRQREPAPRPGAGAAQRRLDLAGLRPRRRRPGRPLHPGPLPGGCPDAARAVPGGDVQATPAQLGRVHRQGHVRAPGGAGPGLLRAAPGPAAFSQVVCKHDNLSTYLYLSLSLYIYIYIHIYIYINK